MDPIHPITPRPSAIPPTGPLRPERVSRERDRARERGGDQRQGAPKQPDPQLASDAADDENDEPPHRIDVRV